MTRHLWLTSAACAAVVLGAGTASADNLRFMTGPQGGSWYPMGGAIKNVVEEAVPDTSLQVMPSVASAIGKTTLEQMAADIGVPCHPPPSSSSRRKA